MKKFILLLNGILICISFVVFLFGQKSENSEKSPKLFAEGIINTSAAEYNPSFTPDGKTVYFTRRVDRKGNEAIMFSRFEKGKWTTPQTAEFSGSGGVNAASWRKPSDLPPIPVIVQALTATFGDGTNPATLIANDLFKLFGEIPPDKIAELPFFYLDCGTEDELGLLKPNQQLAEIIVSRKIPHEYRQFPGRHITWQEFRLPYLLGMSGRILTQQKATSSGK